MSGDDGEVPDDSDVVMTRIAMAADRGALARLRYHWRVGEGEQGLDGPSFEKAFITWAEAHETTHMAFLATRGDDPVGMAWLAVVDRVPGPERFTRRSGYIQSVYVAPTDRGRGVGTRLVQLLLDHAGGLGLEYVPPSENALSLCRRLGFARSDRTLELRWR